MAIPHHNCSDRMFGILLLLRVKENHHQEQASGDVLGTPHNRDVFCFGSVGGGAGRRGDALLSASHRARE